MHIKKIYQNEAAGKYWIVSDGKTTYIGPVTKETTKWVEDQPNGVYANQVAKTNDFIFGFAPNTEGRPQYSDYMDYAKYKAAVKKAYAKLKAAFEKGVEEPGAIEVCEPLGLVFDDGVIDFATDHDLWKTVLESEDNFEEYLDQDLKDTWTVACAHVKDGEVVEALTGNIKKIPA